MFSGFIMNDFGSKGWHCLGKMYIAYIKNYLCFGFKHDKVCLKSSPRKFLISKKSLFNIHIQKDITNLFKLHFEIIDHFTKFIVSWT